MAASDPARRRQIAAAGAAARHRLPDAAARRAEVVTSGLEARIRDAAPSLTTAQRCRLAAALDSEPLAVSA